MKRPDFYTSSLFLAVALSGLGLAAILALFFRA